jgi:hypothetical protein
MSQFRDRLREGSRWHDSIRLPSLVGNRDVHSHIRSRGGVDKAIRRFPSGQRLSRQCTVGFSADCRTHRLSAGG